MNKIKCKGFIISDFTTDSLSGYLNNDGEHPKVITTVSPFNQVIPVLMQKNKEYWKDDYDFSVVWTRPESIIRSFSYKLEYQDVPLNKILKEVDSYCSLLSNISKKVKILFVPLWLFPSYHRGYGMLDMKPGTGIAYALMRMNLRLTENLKDLPNVYILNSQKWVEKIGKNAFNQKLWYMAKVAFSNEVFQEAMLDIKSALRGIRGDSRKLIILDLDDTLWGGVVGEVGWENIKLGGHDHIGEACLDFQRTLKSFLNRGILLGIVSKNEESVALEAIKKHPEMILKFDDFAGWKINWKDKAQNIVDLAQELNLGLQSAVFIDDNPVERSRAREALPDIFVPELPEDKTLYKSFLLSLNCFDSAFISKEDLKRPRMYLSERKRKYSQMKNGSFDGWLKSLKTIVEVEELNKANLKRANQLLNKTNQMNLSTRRLTENEFTDWANSDCHKVWVFSVSDKFGDSGLVGIISLDLGQKKARIVDFVLSCRVVGRCIEEAMVLTAFKHVKSLCLDELYARYLPTAKNKPCLEFWKRSGFRNKEGSADFRWAMNDDYPFAAALVIKIK